MTAAGCEQKVENQGNFAKTEEFFKEMDSTGAHANADAQAQTTQNAEESSVIQAQAPATPAAPTETVADAAFPTNPTINDIQLALQNANLYVGKIDGVLGPKTKQAILDFQTQNNLKVDGKVGPKTWGQLKGYLTKSVPSTPVMAAATQSTASND